jgi:ankyrin repeat protein
MSIFLIRSSCLSFVLLLGFLPLAGCANNPSPHQALEQAVEKNDPAAVQANLRGGVDVKNYDGETPLIIAAKSGSSDAMKTLIDAGAEVNLTDTSYKYTPLHWAAYNGQIEAAKVLLSHGANIEAREYTNSTPLSLAAKRGNVEIVRLFLDKGANPNVRDGDLWTPLQLAAYYNQEAVAEALVTHGADLSPRIPGKNQTALGVAEEYHYNGVAKVLRDHGAK